MARGQTDRALRCLEERELFFIRVVSRLLLNYIAVENILFIAVSVVLQHFSTFVP